MSDSASRSQRSIIDPEGFQDSDWASINDFFKQHPYALFLHKGFRISVAKYRAKKADLRDQWAGSTDRLVDFAIDYNTGNMDKFIESHVVRLLRPLSVIDPVYDRAGDLSLLSVGPRNENELFHLLALGFNIENISAIDLISNSPLVQVADMHDMPFDDNRFDVAVSGWTLPYSKDPKRALEEHVRVLKPGGLLCIGLTRIPPDHADALKLEEADARNYLSADEVLEDIGPAVTDVVYRHDPVDPASKGGIMLIVRVKQ
ncbi:MAG: class I SAM-dependent methyltransferase [Rhodospirillaceae bacterium]|nr:class I SAM-dependent methyltransferase [Rhodospirillaceae bacterium]